MARIHKFIVVLVSALVFLLSGCDEEVAPVAAAAKPAPFVAGAAALASAGPAAAGLPPLSVQVGAGYNEQIANINNSLIAKSGVTWVRAYVNLSRNFWVFANTFPAPSPTPTPTPNPWPRSTITGLVESNIIQQTSNVSNDSDTLAIAALDQLINAKAVSVGGQPIKIILSLKHDFSYPYPKGAKVPLNQFPDFDTTDGKKEIEEMVTSITNLLLTNDRGNNIDILVTGNEPMFEIQPGTDDFTGTKYKNYLNYLIQEITALQAAQRTASGNPNDWDFEIFVGALNSPLPPTTDNKVLPVILKVAEENPAVAGIDLHEHVEATSEVHTDIQYVREHTKLRPLGTQPLKLIVSEFSIIRLLEKYMNPTPPVSTPPLYEFINNTITQAAAGTPTRPSDFLAYFLAQGWYPHGWFSEMIDAFEAERVTAVTYGIEEVPRIPWSGNKVAPTVMPWVLNGVYNATLLGRSSDGYPNTNPLVYPGFRDAVDRAK